MIDWLKERKKAIFAALAAAPVIVQYWAPYLDGEVRKGVLTAVLVLGVLGVHQARNADRFRRARR